MASSRTRGGVLCALLVCALSLCLTAHCRKIPNYVQVCKRNDPLYSQCVLQSLESIRPRLAKGIPRMKVPPAEPFVLPALDVERDLANLKIRAHLENITALGGTGFVVDNLELDPYKLTIKVSVTLPRVAVRAHYDVDGRLLVVPLRGQGIFVGNFTNTKIDIAGSGKEQMIGGQKYVQIDKLRSTIKVDGSNLEFHNENPADAIIANTAAAFIKENKQRVFEIAMPVIQDTVDEVATAIGNRIFQALPLEEVLPE